MAGLSRLRTFVLVLSLVVIGTGVSAITAGAAPAPTSISLSLPGAARTGQFLPVTASLHAGSAPVANAVLHLAYAGRTTSHKTNGAGVVYFRLRRNLPPGRYTLTVTFRGNRLYGPASASGVITVLPLLGTTLSISVPPTTQAGQHMEIHISLLTAAGPLRRAPIHLYFNGNKVVTLETDGSGNATYRLRRSFPAGAYTVTAVYHGNRPRGINPASSSASLTILPIHLTLQVMPPIPGVDISFDGQIYRADASGAAHVDVTTAGYHNLAASEVSPDPRIKLRFVRWADGVPTASRRYHILADRTIYLSYATAFLTTVHIVDADGHSLEGPDLSKVMGVGPAQIELQLWPRNGDLWLELPPPSRTSLAGLPANFRYSIASAIFQGSSVANRGDSTFTPGLGRVWEVRLRLYTLQIHVRKPVLGAGHTAIVVTSQTGLRLQSNLATDGNSVFKDLARSDYTVHLVGPGYSLPVEISLTRSQYVEMPAASREEFIIAYELLVLAAFLFALTVRRRIRIQRRLESMTEPPA
ncbi:MAG: hypothetical protein ACYDAL_13850 [Candidatus Dormibacteraceae bacterium]